MVATPPKPTTDTASISAFGTARATVRSPERRRTPQNARFLAGLQLFSSGNDLPER